MPIEEAILNGMLVLVAFSAVMGLTGMFLSHRRKMASIKHGKAAGADEATTRENIELRETVGLMQDRIAVLEQIATDPAQRTAREIEDLR